MKATESNLILHATETSKGPKTAIATELTRRLADSFWTAVIAGTVVLTAGTATLQAQPITVPNFSFESQTAPGVFPFVNGNVDNWAKIPEPAYFGPATGGQFPWDGTAGLFLDVNPYTNHVGSQAGYLLAFPQATLMQHYDSMDWNDATPSHEFDATYEVGKSYQLTVGIFGKDTLNAGSTLKVSLFYVDGSSVRIDVGSTTITYSAAAFPVTPSLGLVDYQVLVGAVQAGDPWAGQHIGIQLESTTPIELASTGNWDFDNVRLDGVPEPGTLSLLAAGMGGLLFRWARSRRRT